MNLPSVWVLLVGIPLLQAAETPGIKMLMGIWPVGIVLRTNRNSSTSANRRLALLCNLQSSRKTCTRRTDPKNSPIQSLRRK